MVRAKVRAKVMVMVRVRVMVRAMAMHGLQNGHYHPCSQLPPAATPGTGCHPQGVTMPVCVSSWVSG